MYFTGSPGLATQWVTINPEEDEHIYLLDTKYGNTYHKFLERDYDVSNNQEDVLLTALDYSYPYPALDDIINSQYFIGNINE